MDIPIQSESKPRPEGEGAFRAARLFANYALTPADPSQPMHGAATLRFDPDVKRKEEPMTPESQYAAAAPATAFRWPRVPAWLLVLAAFGIVYALAAASSSDASRDAAKAAAADAGHAAFEQKLSAIATSAAFQAQCGKAARIEHLGPPTYESGTTRLTYPIDKQTSLGVYLGPDHVVGFDTVLHGRRYIPGGAAQSQDEKLLSEIGCQMVRPPLIAPPPFQ